MKISLTRIKHAKWASEETQCFDAMVCIDGAPCIHASNDGHGGMTFLRDLPGHKGSVARLDAYAATLPPEVSANLKDPLDPARPFTRKRGAEDLVDDLLYEWLDLKDMKRALKRRAVFAAGNEIREYKVSWETLLAKHPELIERVRAEYPDARWLNVLPEAEALALWRANRE